jgi:dipeptidase E
MKLLLLSNSTQHAMAYLEHAEDAIRAFLDGTAELLFVPFALADHDSYTAVAREGFARWGIEVRGLHEVPVIGEAVDRAQAIFVGGGNSFRLLKTLQSNGGLNAIRRCVRQGTPYMGTSAGSNLACPSIRTTNDMPIVEPRDFGALGLLPFQINPHYVDPAPSSQHMGETREQRIREFHEENGLIVLGLREGSWLVREDEELRLGGLRDARLFRRGQEPREISAPARLDELLVES